MKFPTQTRSFNKNEFRCFLCRKVHKKQDGQWIDWAAMQVHLCVGCNQTSLAAPERNTKSK